MRGGEKNRGRLRSCLDPTEPGFVLDDDDEADVGFDFDPGGRRFAGVTGLGTADEADDGDGSIGLDGSLAGCLLRADDVGGHATSGLDMI